MPFWFPVERNPKNRYWSRPLTTSLEGATTECNFSQKLQLIFNTHYIDFNRNYATKSIVLFSNMKLTVLILNYYATLSIVCGFNFKTYRIDTF